MNSLWQTVGSLIKYFRFTRDQVLWEISWANLMLYSATIPTYETDKKGDDGPVQQIDEEDIAGFFKF